MKKRTQESGAAWKGYDDNALPELSEDQLATFRRVTPEEHQRFKQMVAQGRRGRPRKEPSEKENPVAIRLSETFLAKLKARAKARGFAAWQTYAKKVLADDLEQSS